MQAVAVFNNKGGVGKTTLLCNLAAALAHFKRRAVLVIDADPQCNATQYMFDDDDLLDFYEKKKTFTLQTIIKPLSLGKGYSADLVVRRSHRFGVDVVIGDPAMSLTEDLLATDWVQGSNGNTRGLRTTFVFSNLIERCARYDYVLFDMGPSFGAINRAVLVAADFFVVPMSIDIFSLRAIDNISIQLSAWKKLLERSLELVEDPDELEVEDPSWRLQFGGYVTQQYNARTSKGEKRPVEAFDRIMREVPKKIEDKLISGLGLHGTADDYHLGSIPSLHSLVPMAQSARAPIFDLGSADGVRGAHFGRVKDYARLIEAIASKFDGRVSK